uniref:DUF4817 domain-containing protein n=1 Tax=Strongyloides stercoralis TaxID=6248 RepID=A0A0K0ECK6_STRER
MVYTMEECFFMALEYYKWENANKVRKNFTIKFRKDPPSVSSVTRVFKKLMETGSVNDRKHARRRTVTHEENSLMITKQVEENRGQVSTRQLALDNNMSRSSVMKVLDEGGYFPYRKQFVHEMKPEDPGRRLAFCLEALERVREGLIVGPTLIFSDESYFHLTGYVNKQNDRTWAISKPNALLAQPVYTQKIGVWAALSVKKIYGLIFFEGNLDSTRYISEVVDVFVDELKTDNEDLQYIVFQQDGTSCHTSFETMPHPKSVFSPSNLISQNLDFGWPLRSPDLNPLDFYFWGRLRDLVFKNQPNSIEILKNRITAAIREVKRDELERVYLNFLTRLERCVKVEDGYFE